MNEKKKKIFITICIAIIVICIVVIAFMNQKTEVLDKKSKMLDDVLTETESGQTVETEYTRLEGEDFFFKVPTSFKSLDNQTISQKYTSNIPDMVFANKDGTINFIFAYNEKLVIINFNCTKDLMKEGKGVGDFLIESLFFKTE